MASILPVDHSSSASNPMQPVVDTLNDTFSKGVTRSLEWRKTQLLALEKMVRENQDVIKQALKDDLNKCDAEAWAAEIGFLLTDIKHTVKHLKKWAGRRRVSTPLVAIPGNSYQLPEPLGTVLIIGAWNYPFQLVLAPYVAALAAGNCALLKPSELSPATSKVIAELIPRYMDPSAVAVIEGGKEETTQLLACRWDHIFYTGGEVVGKIVMRAASEHLTPVTLELGGKSPCVVDKNTDLTVTARRIVWGKWMNAGQTCIAPDYILVEEDFVATLVDALKREIETQYSGQPLSSDDYGKIVNARHLSRLSHYLEGLEVAFGGQIDEQATKMSPTLVVNPPEHCTLMQEEIFGPILPIVPVSDMNAAIAFINARPKPLALYLFTHDSQLEQQVLAQTSAGNVCVNDTMMFMLNPDLPFGGVGNSGMGAYHGQAGFDTFSHLKTVMHRSFKFDAAFRYAPFTALKRAILKKLL